MRFCIFLMLIATTATTMASQSYVFNHLPVQQSYVFYHFPAQKDELQTQLQNYFPIKFLVETGAFERIAKKSHGRRKTIHGINLLVLRSLSYTSREYGYDFELLAAFFSSHLVQTLIAHASPQHVFIPQQKSKRAVAMEQQIKEAHRQAYSVHSAHCALEKQSRKAADPSDAQ